MSLFRPWTDTAETDTVSDGASEEPGSPQRKRRVPALLVSAAVGLVSLAFVWKFRTLPVPTDPWHYVLAGTTFPEPTWNMVGLTRYGVVLPDVLVTKLFG